MSGSCTRSVFRPKGEDRAGARARETKERTVGSTADGFWTYVIEINPKWIEHLPTSKVPAGTKRLLYVGSTDHGPEERLAEHLSGRYCAEDKERSAGRFFKTIRRRREEQGLAGRLVDGEDAWLVRELIERFDSADEAHMREGTLADELGAMPGTVAWSDRGTSARKREQQRLRTAKSKARKARAQRA